MDEWFNNPAWEVLQLALIFVFKPVWDFLTTAGTVAIRLEQNRSQNNLLNYAITNIGSRKVTDVRVEFSRGPQNSGELWTALEGASSLQFGDLAPGQRLTSMFAPGTAGVEPIKVKLTYRNGPFFPRLGQYILPSFCRRQRTVSAVLDMSEFLNFRPNVGYEGKKELQNIEQVIKEGFRGLKDRSLASITRKAGIEETTPTAARWAQNMPTGTTEVEEEGDEKSLEQLRKIENGEE